MISCRLCQSLLGTPNYSSIAPSLTSKLDQIGAPTEVFICQSCGLAQSPALDDTTAYYDRDYRISLESADHDQLITLNSGETISRNDLQCRLIVKNVEFKNNAKILDFGGAKGTSLKNICSLKSDLIPYIFDVSNDYEPSWAGWVAKSNTAVHTIPPAWLGHMDVIVTNFVLEHIPSLVETLTLLRDLLSPDGVLFLTVPNSLANTGDLLVVDHVNHFTAFSLFNLFQRTGFSVKLLDENQLPGGLMIVAQRFDGRNNVPQPQDQNAQLLEALSGWEKSKQKLISTAHLNSKSPSAIFGAGFYGNWIASILNGIVGIECFLDNNVHLQNSKIGNLAVLDPDYIPEHIETVYVGVNPAIAKKVMERELFCKSKRLVFLD